MEHGSIETVDAAGEALELTIEHQSTLWQYDTIRDDFLASYFKKAQEASAHNLVAQYLAEQLVGVVYCDC